MKKILFFAAVIVMFTACRQRHGSGNIITETRQVDHFNAVSVGSTFDVEIQQGASTSVQVEADDNLMKYIETTVSGDKLRIGFKKSFSIINAHLKVFITAPAIDRINSSGAAEVKVLGVLKSDHKISLETSGASSIVAEVDAPEVDTDVSGAGNIDVKGRTRTHTARASGSGDIKGRQLLSENVEATCSGAGSIHVYASVHLHAKASGAGNVKYSGDAVVQSQTSGAGEVKKEN